MKKFNISGSCIPTKHYMVNIDEKINEIDKLIKQEEYFTINRSRQFGKTTLLSALYRKLSYKYLIIRGSFEGLGQSAFKSEKTFLNTLIEQFADRLSFINKEISNIIYNKVNNVNSFQDMSKLISEIVKKSDKPIVLTIDEIDKSSNNQIFLNFLGLLREKYLLSRDDLDYTFQSVILAGVHDIKNLKIQIRDDQEKKLNSPWNIAIDFKVDLSFNSKDISSMLDEYINMTKIKIDIDKISNEIYKFTNGYPFLVSKICKTIDEDLNKDWSIESIENAIKLLLDEKNTLFDDLIKNLINNKNLYNSVYDIVVLGSRKVFNAYTHEIGLIYGIFRKNNNFLEIHNKIFEILIYNYMITKHIEDKGEVLTYKYKSDFVNNNELNIENILLKFQELMKTEYREKDNKFIENQGRLIFLAFLKPIINGKGFYFVEPVTREDNRMDIVITYGNLKYIIELKIWYGEKYIEKGLNQMCSYLEIQNENKGYMLVFNFNKNKSYSSSWSSINGKKIFIVII